jgi:hypothetical protein
MEYIVIPTKNKSESTFFLNLLKKMQKEASTVSSKKMEDMAFIAALKEGEQSGKGSLNKVKAYLSKIAILRYTYTVVDIQG